METVEDEFNVPIALSAFRDKTWKLSLGYIIKCLQQEVIPIAYVSHPQKQRIRPLVATHTFNRHALALLLVSLGFFTTTGVNVHE